MEIREIVLDENQQERYLSYTTIMLLPLPYTRVFAAMEGEDIRALCVLSKADGGEGLILNQLWAGEGDDESLLALVAHLKAICTGEGMVRLNCRYIDSQSNIQRIHSLMEKLPHKPLMLNGHRLSYNLEALDVDGVINKFKNLMPLLRQVKKYKEVPRIKYNKFYEKMRQIGRPPYSETRDEEFDRYFEYRGGVSGYINTSRTTMEILLVADSYVYDKEIRQYALPAMMASLLMEARDKMPHDARIVLQIYEEPFYQGVTTMLGEPIVSEIITEYVLQF